MEMGKVKTDDGSLENDITSDVEAGTVETRIRELIDGNDIIVFSKSTCPFCFEMKRTLVSHGVQYAVFEVDKSGAMKQIQDFLKSISDIRTVPNLFVKGKSYGGCNAMKSMEHSGQLTILLAPMIGKSASKSPAISSIGLLWFPEVVNRKVMQLTSFMTFLMCVLCAVFYNRPATRWAVLGLALDFVLRFTFGGAYSVMGSLSAALLSRTTAVFFAGPPKQFAAFCGLFMSALSAAFFVGGEPIGGVVVICGLAFASGLEGIFDFCLGCWIFGHAISFGILSPSVYRPYLNLVEDRKWAYHYVNEKREFTHAENEHVLLPGQLEETPVDLIRKDRLEFEYKLTDVDPIRHNRIDNIAMPMTFAALAYAFKFGDLRGKSEDPTNNVTPFDTGVAYQTLAIVSAVIFGVLMLMYLARAALYFKKCKKEWQHPVFGNFFSAVSICITLFGILYYPEDENRGVAMVWIGAVMQMLISVLKVSSLLFDRLSEEMLNASLMMAPVGNFIGAIGFAAYAVPYDGHTRGGDMNYLSIARLWFGVAMLFAIVLFTLSFRRALHDTHADERMRPLMWIWLATASIVGPAFYQVSGADPAVAKGVFYQSMWSIALFIGVVLSVGYVRGFFTYAPDMSIWVVPFSFAAFSINTNQYFNFVNDGVFYALAIISLVIASTSATVCSFTTLMWIIDGSLFTPRGKWGPVSFMKLAHECFRFSVPKYEKIITGLDETQSVAIEKLLEGLDGLFVTFMEHSHHEDLVLFPRIRRFMPQLNPSMDKEHEEAHEAVGKMEKAVQAFRGSAKDAGDARALLAVLSAEYPPWAAAILPHLRNEEATITVAARKYLPLEYQLQISREVFEITSIDAWRKVIPFTLNNLPMPVWKVRFLKTFLWASPHRAQEIGLIVYHGVDAITYLFLARELPEIVPRGLPGHKRIY